MKRYILQGVIVLLVVLFSTLEAQNRTRETKETNQTKTNKSSVVEKSEPSGSEKEEVKTSKPKETNSTSNTEQQTVKKATSTRNNKEQQATKPVIKPVPTQLEEPVLKPIQKPDSQESSRQSRQSNSSNNYNDNYERTPVIDTKPYTREKEPETKPNDYRNIAPVQTKPSVRVNLRSAQAQSQQTSRSATNDNVKPEKEPTHESDARATQISVEKPNRSEKPDAGQPEREKIVQTETVKPVESFREKPQTETRSTPTQVAIENTQDPRHIKPSFYNNNQHLPNNNHYSSYSGDAPPNTSANDNTVNHHHGGGNNNSNHHWHNNHNNHWYGNNPHHYWNDYSPRYYWSWYYYDYTWNWYHHNNYYWTHYHRSNWGVTQVVYYDFGSYNYTYYYDWYPHHYWIVYPSFTYSFNWDDKVDEFSGFIAEDDWDLLGKTEFKLNIDYSRYLDTNQHWLSDSCPMDGYGIIVKEGRRDYNYYHFDKYGNRLAKRIIDRYSRNRGKVYVTVRGYLNPENHTIKVVSIHKGKAPSNTVIAVWYRPWRIVHRPWRWL